MKGGGLIATGSSSCIIKPNIPCKKNNKKPINDKKISKIVFGKKSKEYTDREKSIDDIIKKIPGYKDWSLVFDEICKPPPFDEAKKMDKGLYDCIGDPSVKESTIKLKGNLNTKKRELFNKHSIMLVGEYGGETLETYFDNEFNEPKEDIKKIEGKFLIMMEKLDKLFHGLVELKKSGISHLDVKPNNIVIKDDNSNFKFIDFGLSAKYDNLKHFKQRAINESKTERIYLWYPPEFLFSQTSKKELNELKDNLINGDFEDFKNHANTYKSVQKIFNRNPKRSFLSIINNYLDKSWDPKFDNIIQEIDVYSLGIMMPILFYNNDILDRIKESILLTNFFELFNLMVSSYWYARIDIENAYILYKGLMEKFTKNKSVKKSFKRKSVKKPVKTKKKKKKTNKKKTIKM